MERLTDDLGAILDCIVADESVEVEATALRRLLVVGGEQNVVQVGKYNNGLKTFQISGCFSRLTCVSSSL